MTTTTTTFTRSTMVQRIAESIFERLPAEDAPKFFAALLGAIGCDGKDLSCVGWKFLAQTLRNMPRQLPEIQEVVDQVIDGLELLAAGGEWPAAANAAAYAAANAAAVAAYAATNAANAFAAVNAAANANAFAAVNAAAAAAAASADARRQWAADAAASACWANAYAPAAACWADAAVAEAAAAADAASASAFAAACCADAAAAVVQQRDLLLQLLTNAPVLEGSA